MLKKPRVLRTSPSMSRRQSPSTGLVRRTWSGARAVRHGSDRFSVRFNPGGRAILWLAAAVWRSNPVRPFLPHQDLERLRPRARYRLLYLAGGFILITSPATGIITLTLLLIVLFVADGILETILAFKLRPAKGWAWILVSGIVSLIVGALIWAKFPSSALWAIGLLVGVNLMFSGFSFLSLAMAGKAPRRRPESSGRR